MRIFVSSTFRDLRAERDSAVEALRRRELVPWGMELFVSEPRTPLQTALDELQTSDAVVLIIGFRAGSLIPDSATVTYTAAEFRRARELGRRIFVFLKTEAGSWRNEETTPALKDALDRFTQEVLSSDITPAYFDTPDRLQIELLLAIDKWDAEGRPGARRVFTTMKEFFAPYESPRPRLFDFDQTLRGRDTEIRTLNEFLGAPDVIVGVLVGRGGIGKSKLLHDWTRDLAEPRVLYVREDGEWHVEAAKEIPAGDVVIVADDAHRLNFLDKLLITIRGLQERQRVRLVLGTRPSGTRPIDAALAVRFDPTQIRRFPRLERVNHRSVLELAQESLGPGHIQYAEALAAVSADTPLVTVVGGRLVARGDISPALLANEGDFRREVFDRFSDEYERLLPAGPVNWRNLLNLIAALAPLVPADRKFLEPATELLHVRPDEIVAAIDQLERNGLLLRGGRLIRIVPDLLSDFLLEGACLTAAGERTGFGDLVFEKYGPEFLSPLLRNLGELDWRITHRDGNQVAGVLERIWAEIERRFNASDAGDRVQLLKALREAALFQPIQVMRLIRLAMTTEAATTVVLDNWKITQEYVILEIPPLLRTIALHPNHFEEAADILWQLAKRDGRRPNDYPEQSQRALKDLAEYGRYKPVVINGRMVDFAARITRQPDAFDGSFTPLDIVDKLLAKEGEFTESEGLSFSVGGFALNYPVVRPIRENALHLLEYCLSLENPKAAHRAVDSLAYLLPGFLPMVARQPAADEIAWQDEERLTVLRIMETHLRTEARVPIVWQIRSMLRRARPENKENPIAQRIDAILASVQPSDNLTIFDAFATSPWELNPFDTIEAANEARREMLLRGIGLFRHNYPSPREQVNSLLDMVKDAEASGVQVTDSCYDFIDELCTDPAFRDEFLSYALGDPHPLLAQMIAAPLRRLRSADPARYGKVGAKAAGHKNAHVAYGAANAVSVGPGLTAPIGEDVAVLAALVDNHLPVIRQLTFTGIRRLGAHPRYEREAIDLLIRSGIEDDPRMADEMCSTVDLAGIPLRNLTESDIRAMLQKLLTTKRIDDHHIGRFLEWVGEHHPTMLWEFIIQRLDRYADMERSGESTQGYSPVPNRRFGGAFHALQRTSHYRDLLNQIRDRFVTRPRQSYWLRELFWSVGTLDATTLGAIDELLHSGDADQVTAAIGLLGGAPPGLALNHPWFAVQVIEECGRISHELGQKAASLLIGNAHKGAFQRAVGQPSPRYLAMRDRSAALRDAFSAGSSGKQLFQDLYDSAVSALERERMDDDEQIGFN